MPPTPSNPRMQALNQALKAGDWPRAEAILLEITKAEKRNPEAFFHLGMVYRRQGREREAVKAFDRALKVSPKLPQVEFEKAQALLALDELVPAKRAFNAVLRQVPEDLGCRANLALIAKLEKRYADAVTLYDELLKEQGLPDNQDALLRMGLVESLRDGREFDRMRQEARTLAARHPYMRSTVLSLLTQGQRGRVPLKVSEV